MFWETENRRRYISSSSLSYELLACFFCCWNEIMLYRIKLVMAVFIAAGQLSRLPSSRQKKLTEGKVSSSSFRWYSSSRRRRLITCSYRSLSSDVKRPNFNSRERVVIIITKLQINLAWIFVNLRVPFLFNTPAIKLLPPSARDRSFTSHRQNIRLLMLELMKLFVISSPMFYRYSRARSYSYSSSVVTSRVARLLHRLLFPSINICTGSAHV